MMNQLETNLTLWAICSILLFEILFIIVLCRCCFNRIKPKKFYIKREEYEYLKNLNNSTQSKFPSTILRPPPHADELAHIGTIRIQNPLLSYDAGFPNLAFYRDDKDERNLTSQYWIELQSPIINTSQLPPADYEIHSYPTDDYSFRQPLPRSTLIDFHPYRNDYIDVDDEIENYRLQYHSQIKRTDTSTESYGMNYSNLVPKSILKSGINTISPVDLPLPSYLQIQNSRPSSEHNESPQPILFSTISSKQRMKFANISQLNDIEWEVPREFQTKLILNHERYSLPIIDSKIHIPWRHEMNINQPDYFLKGDITQQQQQQAFEY